MFENPRRGRQARNFTTNVPKILDVKSSSEQIFSENCRWVPLKKVRWLWSSRRVVRVVYGFPTPSRREEMMIEIINFTSLIVNLSWQSCVG